MERVTCNLCGSANQKPLYMLADWLLDQPQTQTTLVQCQDCGLVYQNPRPGIEEIGQYYPSDYEPFTTTKKRPSWLLQKAIDYGLNIRAKPIVQSKKNGTPVRCWLRHWGIPAICARYLPLAGERSRDQRVCLAGGA